MQTIKSKKGVMGTLVTAGLGIVVLAVVAVLGVVMLSNMGSSLASCGTIGGGASTYNTTTGYCCNASGTCLASSASLASQASFYAEGKLGSESGGLLTYLPIIIPAIAVIGILTMLFGIWKFGGKNDGM